MDPIWFDARMGKPICDEDIMQKRLIWLVEDEASIADTLIYALQTDGFEVGVVPLGQPLLARLEQTRPDFSFWMWGCRTSAASNCASRLGH